MNNEEKKACPSCFNRNEGCLELLEKLSGFHNGEYVQNVLTCPVCGYTENNKGKKMSKYMPTPMKAR